MESDKYVKALNQHPFVLTDEEVSEKVKEITAEYYDENRSADVMRTLYSCVDLTTLNTTDSKESIWKFVEKINQFEGQHPEIQNVAAVCVFPNFVAAVKESLTANVRIAAVSGGFPSSQTFTEVKVAETALTIADGAEEIDVVMNVGLFLDKEYQELCEEISEIKEVCRGATLKVILETGALPDGKSIHQAAILNLYSGADFLKTSTGKGYPGATPEAAYVLCRAIKSYHEKTGNKAGIKISGGVATPQDAVHYYTIVKHVLGEEWCTPSLFRLGSSRLADNLLTLVE